MSLSRREMLSVSLAGLGSVAVRPAIGAIKPDAPQTRSFHLDHILGTSLDVWMDASESAAASAETVLLDEIERLRRVFSLHDSESELSRLNRSTGAVPVSSDMLAVLNHYATWNAQTSGACNPQLSTLHALWSAAATSGREPSQTEIAAATNLVNKIGWKIDAITRTIERSNGATLNLNSIAKGYILQRAADELRKRVPGIESALINLGGDMCHWGSRPALIGVQDPFAFGENQTPRALLKLSNASIATSGGYLRGYDIGGKQHSHILDPRSGRPADNIASATVVAADSVTANTLATALCVLHPHESLRLIAATKGAECLIIGRDSTEFRSVGFDDIDTDNPEESPSSTPTPKPDEKKTGDSTPWPANFEMKISTALPQPGGRARRPYVAVWIEDAKEKAVRTLVVWGNSRKYLPDLSGWWKFARDDKELVAAMTRATRGPGKYDIVWDGKDDRGQALPQGTYTVKIEVHREHGRHLFQTGKVVCGPSESKLTIDKNDETEQTSITYSKKTEPAK